MKFEQPPIVELGLGIQFQKGLLTPEIIAEFYIRNKDKYPILQESQPLGKHEYRDGLIIEVPESLAISDNRKLLFSKDKQKLVQIQHNKFYLNWRKNSEKAFYPSFDPLFNEFVTLLSDLGTFINENSLDVELCEIVYVDALPLDSTSHGFDLHNVLENHTFNQSVTSLDINISTMVEECNGVSNFRVRSANKQGTGEKVVLLEISIKGALQVMDIHEWFLSGRRKCSLMFEESVHASMLNKLGFKN